MTTLPSIILLAIGCVLIYFGVQASESISSDISRFFTDSPTNKSIWLLLGGIALAVVGLVGVVRSPRVVA